MDILIITGIFPPDIGGPATYVPQIAKGLTERRHKITVLTLSDRAKSGIQDPRYPFRVVRLSRKMFKPWRWVRTVLAIIRLGRNADVLFVNGLVLEAVVANFALRKPMVQKVVGDLAWERATNNKWTEDNFEEFQRKRYGLKVELLKILRSWWIRRADRVVAPSHYTARWVAGWGVAREKIVVIHNGVEPVDGVRPAPLPLRTPFKLVTVGRLIPLKGIDSLMEAIAPMENTGLVIIGDGPDLRRLEQRAHGLAISDRVFFAGARSKLDTWSLMAACDIYVLNSTHENFPHVILEAMSLGLPVIATAVGGVSEMITDGKNGGLVPLSNSHALYKTISRILFNPTERAQLAEGARREIGRFTIEKMLGAAEALLQVVACERRAR